MTILENVTKTERFEWKFFTSPTRKFVVKGRKYFATRWPMLGENRSGWWTNYPNPSNWVFAGKNLAELQTYADSKANHNCARWPVKKTSL
jgi:hypothetical protein